MKKLQLFTAPALTLALFASCEKTTSDGAPPGGYGNLFVAVSSPNPDGMSGGGYMQLTEAAEGLMKLDNANAIPIPYGVQPIVIDNDIFVCPSYMGDGRSELQKWSFDQNTLKLTGVLPLPSNSSATAIEKVSEEKAYLSMAGLGKIMVFDPKTMNRTGEIDLSSLGIKDNNPDPGAILSRDELLFVGLSQMVGGWISPADYTQADVAVIDMKTDRLVKMISDKTGGFSQATRPVERNSIFVDEKGDMYISCLGNFGLVQGHKAGVLRIKKGETDFDPDYHFAISGAAIAGEPNTGSFIAKLCYTGGGKAYAYIDIPAYYKPGEQGHTAISNRAVEIDIYNRTIKKLDGVELSDGWSALCLGRYKNGKMVIANGSVTSKGVYLLDPATGKVSPSPMMEVVGNPLELHYFGK